MGFLPEEEIRSMLKVSGKGTFSLRNLFPFYLGLKHIPRSIFKKKGGGGGWRDDSSVKSTCCSSAPSIHRAIPVCDSSSRGSDASRQAHGPHTFDQTKHPLT
jgi:hypothetical protein